MASRAGKRPKGSDGSDYLHREKVPDHVQLSVKWKSNLRYILIAQVICLIYNLGVVSLTFDYPSIICGLGYAIGLPACWQAIRKNNIHFINVYGVCCSMLGIFPMTYTLYCFLWTNAIPSHHWLRLVQAVAVIASNGSGCYHAKQLMTLWTTPPSKRRRQ